VVAAGAGAGVGVTAEAAGAEVAAAALGAFAVDEFCFGSVEPVEEVAAAGVAVAFVVRLTVGVMVGAAEILGAGAGLAKLAVGLLTAVELLRDRAEGIDCLTGVAAAGELCLGRSEGDSAGGVEAAAAAGRDDGEGGE